MKSKKGPVVRAIRSWLLWEKLVESGRRTKQSGRSSTEVPRHTDCISFVSGGSSVQRKHLSQVPFDGACGETITQRGVKAESLDS